MITIVEINENIQKQLDLDIKAGHFKAEVRDLIKYWITELEEVGFEDYLSSPTAKEIFNDHELKDSRQGERSITLNPNGGRLIYKTVKNKVVVKVIKITHDHNYD